MRHRPEILSRRDIPRRSATSTRNDSLAIRRITHSDKPRKVVIAGALREDSVGSFRDKFLLVCPTLLILQSSIRRPNFCMTRQGKQPAILISWLYPINLDKLEQNQIW